MTAVSLLIFSTAHSYQDGAESVHGVIADLVFSLMTIVIFMTIINVILFFAHLLRGNWDRLTVTSGIIFASILLWITAFIIDIQIAFFDK